MEFSIVVAGTGDLFIHVDCLHSQSMYVRREDAASFIRDPQHTRVLVFPPFASVALTCFTTMRPVDTVTLKRDDVDYDRFILTFRSAGGPIVAYVSATDEPVAPRTLAAAGVDIVITPQLVGRIDCLDSRPSVAVIASIPRPERPNYPSRFLVDPARVSKAVASALENQIQST